MCVRGIRGGKVYVGLERRDAIKKKKILSICLINIATFGQSCEGGD